MSVIPHRIKITDFDSSDNSYLFEYLDENNDGWLFKQSFKDKKDFDKLKLEREYTIFVYSEDDPINDTYTDVWVDSIKCDSRRPVHRPFLKI